MTLFDQIQKDYIEARKAKNVDLGKSLSLLLSDLKYEKINSGKDVSDEVAIKIIQKTVKQRTESKELAKEQGRDDFAQNEAKEIEILEHYLPQMLSEEETEKLVLEAIKETSATSMKDMGKVMGLSIKKASGLADSSIIKKLVEKHLN